MAGFWLIRTLSSIFCVYAVVPACCLSGQALQFPILCRMIFFGRTEPSLALPVTFVIRCKCALPLCGFVANSISTSFYHFRDAGWQRCLGATLQSAHLHQFRQSLVARLVWS